MKYISIFIILYVCAGILLTWAWANACSCIFTFERVYRYTQNDCWKSVHTRADESNLFIHIHVCVCGGAYECENFPTISDKCAWTRSSLTTTATAKANFNSNSTWIALNSAWALLFTGITSFKSSLNYLQVLQIKCDLYKCGYASDFMFMRASLE